MREVSCNASQLWADWSPRARGAHGAYPFPDDGKAGSASPGCGVRSRSVRIRRKKGGYGHAQGSGRGQEGGGEDLGPAGFDGAQSREVQPEQRGEALLRERSGFTDVEYPATHVGVDVVEGLDVDHPSPLPCEARPR